MDDTQVDYETLTGTKSQARIDAENLDLLALFHFILGAVTVLFSSFFIAHVVMGITLAHNPNVFGPPPSALSATHDPSDGGFPSPMGYVIATMGALVVLGGWTLGGLTVYAGRCLKRRTNYVFVQVVAGLNCVFVQALGTALGVFTFIVLVRPSVKALFPR